MGCEWCSEGVGCEWWSEWNEGWDEWWSEGVGCEWSEGVGCEWRVWGVSGGVSVFLVLHCTVRANLAVSLFPLVPLSVPLVSAGLL